MSKFGVLFWLVLVGVCFFWASSVKSSPVVGTNLPANPQNANLEFDKSSIEPNLLTRKPHVNTLVLMIKYQDSTAEADRRITKKSLQKKVFTGKKSANQFYRDQTNNKIGFEGIKNSSGDVQNWFRTKVKKPVYANTVCGGVDQLNKLLSSADKIAQKRFGWNTEAYDKIVYVLPDDCSYAGGLTMDQKRVIVFNDPYTQTFVHELGHTFGLGHARSMYCINQNRVEPFSNDGLLKNCKTDEYGNRFDPMGKNLYFYSFEQTHRQLLQYGEITHFMRASKNGVYRIYNSEAKGFEKQKLLLIPRFGFDKFGVEYYQPSKKFYYPSEQEDFEDQTKKFYNGARITYYTDSKDFDGSVLSFSSKAEEIYAFPVGSGINDKRGRVNFKVINQTPNYIDVEVNFKPW